MQGIYAFEGAVPVVHPTAFVHPNAAVTGHVTIGRDVYIGPGAALRGDWGAIEIADGCNVQESCTIHMFPGVTVVLEEAAHIGHGAVIHGARIGKNALVGMNAVVMDDAVVGAGAIVGALSLVPAGMVIPERKVAVGNPAKIVKDGSAERREGKPDGPRLSQAPPGRLHASFRECEPLREVPPDRPRPDATYRTWRETRRPAGGGRDPARELRRGGLGRGEGHRHGALPRRDRRAGCRRDERRPRLRRDARLRPTH